ncbi:acyltransferase family protein, partial [Clavibacter michiganensis]
MTSTRPTRTSRSTTVAPEGSSTRSFRGDIQGLRALAVVAVILDHLLAWPSGGFLGVDVFFVISGFIITSLLLRQHDKRGRISFAEFYRKRVKRILPASTAVLLVTVLASWMVFLSGRASAIAWDSVAAFFFVANWRFAATDTDYWAAD